MHPDFAEHVAKLPELCERLCSSEPLTLANIAKLSCGGVYLFSGQNGPCYVGRTRNLRNRHRAHCGPSSKENQAAFAFRLAREEVGATKPSYKREGSRKALMTDLVFAAAFVKAKERIRSMEFRFVREENDYRQALLEMYVSLETGAQHNSFGTT